MYTNTEYIVQKRKFNTKEFYADSESFKVILKKVIEPSIQRITFHTDGTFSIRTSYGYENTPVHWFNFLTNSYILKNIWKSDKNIISRIITEYPIIDLLLFINPERPYSFLKEISSRKLVSYEQETLSKYIVKFFAKETNFDLTADKITVKWISDEDKEVNKPNPPASLFCIETNFSDLTVQDNIIIYPIDDWTSFLFRPDFLRFNFGHEWLSKGVEMMLSDNPIIYLVQNI